MVRISVLFYRDKEGLPSSPFISIGDTVFEETTLIMKNFLEKNPGSRANEIAEILGVKDLSYHLKKLLKAGAKKVKKGKSVRFYINEK